jgi:hypothetical protein
VSRDYRNTPDDATAHDRPGAPLPPLGAVGPEMYAPPPAPRSRIAWLLAGAGLLVIILVAAVAAFVLLRGVPTASMGSAAAGYAYLAEESVMAFEMRLDLPSDQRQEFVRFLARLPQFADPSTAERRIDELLAEAVASASGGRASYREDVGPWFAGWIVAGVALSDEPTADEDGTLLAIVGSTDRSAAERGMESLRTRSEWTSQPGPGEVTIWTVTPRFGDDATTYAVTDDAVVLGTTVDAVTAALERQASDAPSLLDVEAFGNAMQRQPGGRMAAFWLDYEGVAEAMASLGRGPDSGASFGFECPGISQPRFLAGSLYARDGRLHLDLGLELADDSQLPVMRDSGLARRVPADTIAFFEAREVGAGIGQSMECLRHNPMLGRQVRELEQRLGQSLDDLIGWAGDAAVAVRFDGSRFSGGLVVKVTDATRAAEAMGQLRAYLTAMGGDGASVREEDYNGARMVVFELGRGSVGEPPAPLPSLAYAFVDDLLVIGVDPSFARAVIDTEASASLDGAAAYRRAMEAAGGSSHAGSMYVDLVAVATLFDRFAPRDGMPTGMPGNPIGELRQTLGALESVAAVSRVEGQVVTMRLLLTTREP